MAKDQLGQTSIAWTAKSLLYLYPKLYPVYEISKRRDVLALFDMVFVQTYLTVVLGIAISVVLPILRQYLPKPRRGIAARDVWDIARPYVILGVFSLVVGLLIVALLGDTLADWKLALLAGYAWDSTLQKLSSNE